MENKLKQDKEAASNLLKHMIDVLGKQPKQQKTLLIPESHMSNLMACEHQLDIIFNRYEKLQLENTVLKEKLKIAESQIEDLKSQIAYWENQ